MVQIIYTYRLSIAHLLCFSVKAANPKGLGPSEGGKKLRKGAGLSPSGLLEAVRRVAPQFQGRSQQDSHELVMALLSECDDELRRTTKDLRDAKNSRSGDDSDSSNEEGNGEKDHLPTLVEKTFGANIWNVVRDKG